MPFYLFEASMKELSINSFTKSGLQRKQQQPTNNKTRMTMREEQPPQVRNWAFLVVGSRDTHHGHLARGRVSERKQEATHKQHRQQ